ncbi:MAG: T9SS type A sorting domain-containing protein [Bacteroidota bacterium]
MRFLFTCVALCSILPIWSCSFALRPFCETVNGDENNLIVMTGRIADTVTHGVTFEVFDVLRGSESRSSFTIWDGTPFDCNGVLGLPADALGNIGDSLIIALPMVDSITNDWEQLGDYRIPLFYSNTSWLRLENGQVKGFIAGDGVFVGDMLEEMAYEDFVQDLVEEEQCAELLVSISAPVLPGELRIFPNPATDQISIVLPQEPLWAEYRIFNVRGQLAQAGTIAQPVVDLWLNPGLYLVEVRVPEGVYRREKIIIQ